MSNRLKELRFRVSDEELASIKENAKQLHMQINPFVRYIGTEYALIIEDRRSFEKYHNRLSLVNRYLHYLADSFDIANVYHAREMPDVYEIRKELFYLLGRLYTIMTHHRTKEYRKAQKDIQKQIENINADKITRPDKHADKRMHSIRIKVSLKEYEKIQKLSTLHHLPISVYLRHISLHPNFVHISYPIFESYAKHAKNNMFKIFDIANRMRLFGDYEWYEMTLVLNAIIEIVENEHKLIREVAYRAPKLIPLKEKYPKIIRGFEIDRLIYENARLNGSLHDEVDIEEEYEDDIDDWMSDEWPHYEEYTKFMEQLDEEIAALNDIQIPDTHDATIDEIVACAKRRTE